VEEQNIGIKCKEIDVVSLIELHQLIELNMGDAELMNRELAHLLTNR
jgi:hypothetical protein